MALLLAACLCLSGCSTVKSHEWRPSLQQPQSNVSAVSLTGHTAYYAHLYNTLQNKAEHAPPEELRDVVRSTNPMVTGSIGYWYWKGILETIAARTNTPPDVLDNLGRMPYDTVLHNVAENSATPPETLLRLCSVDNPVDHNIELLKQHVADRANLPVLLQATLAHDTNSWIRRSIAIRGTDAHTLEQLASDGDAEIRFLIAENPNTDTRTLEQLASDGDKRVRISLAKNNNTGLNILNRLCHDKSEEVCMAAINNNRVPQKTRDDVISYYESIPAGYDAIKRFFYDVLGAEDLTIKAQGDGINAVFVISRNGRTATLGNNTGITYENVVALGLTNVPYPGNSLQKPCFDVISTHMRTGLLTQGNEHRSMSLPGLTEFWRNADRNRKFHNHVYVDSIPLTLTDTAKLFNVPDLEVSHLSGRDMKGYEEKELKRRKEAAEKSKPQSEPNSSPKQELTVPAKQKDRFYDLFMKESQENVDRMINDSAQ